MKMKEKTSILSFNWLFVIRAACSGLKKCNNDNILLCCRCVILLLPERWLDSAYNESLDSYFKNLKFDFAGRGLHLYNVANMVAQ